MLGFSAKYRATPLKQGKWLGIVVTAIVYDVLVIYTLISEIQLH